MALAGLSTQSMLDWRKFAWCTCPHGVVTLTSVLGLPCARFLSPVPVEPASEAESGGELGLGLGLVLGLGLGLGLVSSK